VLRVKRERAPTHYRYHQIDTSACCRAKNTARLAKILSNDVARDYLELAIDSAVTRLEGQDRTEPDMTILSQLRQVDLALHLWQSYYSTVLIPLISSVAAVRKDALQSNVNVVTRVENKVNSLVHRFLDGGSFEPLAHNQD
jgi:hypothetical protein